MHWAVMTTPSKQIQNTNKENLNRLKNKFDLKINLGKTVKQERKPRCKLYRFERKAVIRSRYIYISRQYSN